MGTRILVTCKVSSMPGDGEEKIALMANKCCQKVWNRDFDKSRGDRLRYEGAYFIPTQRCTLVVDNGDIKCSNPTLLFYRWKNGELILNESTPHIRQQLENRCPWSLTEKIAYTDEEYEAKYGKEALEQVVKDREEQLSRGL